MHHGWKAGTENHLRSLTNLSDFAPQWDLNPKRSQAGVVPFGPDRRPPPDSAGGAAGEDDGETAMPRRRSPFGGVMSGRAVRRGARDDEFRPWWRDAQTTPGAC
ncbi:hypothetical protein GCM10010251_00110 [Streptomyces aurantiogriseus]|uniref:Uncharacterized protein n=1 Tax=Streptomyces aurantiogriseus TaxID=66870 RepID=A0A918BSU8_9ACTN|nr:hypothetical protein GCM10010251_00110 [Streptomyces aurantiogriseus]